MISPDDGEAKWMAANAAEIAGLEAENGKLRAEVERLHQESKADFNSCEDQLGALTADKELFEKRWNDTVEELTKANLQYNEALKAGQELNRRITAALNE